MHYFMGFWQAPEGVGTLGSTWTTLEEVSSVGQVLNNPTVSPGHRRSLITPYPQL